MNVCSRCGKAIARSTCTWCAKAPNPPRIPGTKAGRLPLLDANSTNPLEASIARARAEETQP